MFLSEGGADEGRRERKSSVTSLRDKREKNQRWSIGGDIVMVAPTQFPMDSSRHPRPLARANQGITHAVRDYSGCQLHTEETQLSPVISYPPVAFFFSLLRPFEGVFSPLSLSLLPFCFLLNPWALSPGVLNTQLVASFNGAQGRVKGDFRGALYFVNLRFEGVLNPFNQWIIFK